MDPLLFIILCFANWRISSMIAAEEGPFNMFGRFRNWTGVRYDKDGNRFGTNNFSRGLICVWCVSVWVGLVMALLLVDVVNPGVTLRDTLALPFAFSTGAIFIDVMINGR